MLRILPAVLLIALVVYALIDCVRTPDDDMPAGIPKVLWVVLIIVFPGIAALAWIVVSRVARATADNASNGRPGLWSSPSPQRPVRRSGPLAPDDDPDFLARLEAERRRADRERRRAVGQGDTGHEIGSGDDGAAPRELPAGGRPASETPGTTAPGTPSSSGPAVGPGDADDSDGPATPRSPDAGASEDGTSPSSGTSQA
ncbi:phospholipase D-like protein [Georgenia soli]|uniref:Phospholipase D-like protein n=1 Tax=Georgenia soli TaxID=638953 RepID=A0A2A9EQ34_9MICO|nr:PLDc N-terminal domain-containing protein [Georgenia soli]PFG40350.1 phospholipase D-like protein [Georgenia soli]